MTSQTISAATQIDEITPEDRRKSALGSAHADGFSTLDMMNPDKAIGLIASRIFAYASQRAGGERFAKYAMAFLVSTVDEHSDLVTEGFGEIHKLYDPFVGQEIGRIGRLLALHAHYTHSHPAGYTADEWFNEITDISTEISIALETLERDTFRDRGREMLQQVMPRLAKIFGTLWS